MSYRRLRAICVKELHHITRDPRSLAMALAVPVMMLLLFGFALSLDVDRVPTMVLDQNQTQASRALVREFQGSRFFEVHPVSDRATIDRAIDRSSVLMGVVIPRDYSQRLGAGREAQADSAGWQRFQHGIDCARVCGIAGPGLFAGAAHGSVEPARG